MNMLAFRAPVARRWALSSLRTFASDAPSKKKTIQQLAKEISLKNKAVLVRADLNLPRSKEDGSIVDDTRARAVRVDTCGNRKYGRVLSNLCPVILSSNRHDGMTCESCHVHMLSLTFRGSCDEHWAKILYTWVVESRIERASLRFKQQISYRSTNIAESAEFAFRAVTVPRPGSADRQVFAQAGR